jgi:xanthine dehydrogenase accessory factor
VEGVQGRRVDDATDLLASLGVLAQRQIPVLVDPGCTVARSLHPLAIVDARMTKRAPEPMAHEALLYIGLGPGFVAPGNCSAVIETERGHTLGRVSWEGAALGDTAVPAGDSRRILRAPSAGTLQSSAKIGQHFRAGETIGFIDENPIFAPFSGILRGILRPGTATSAGMKIGDVDEHGDPRVCEVVSDKSLAIGGGVLEALLTRPEVRGRLWA